MPVKIIVDLSLSFRLRKIVCNYILHHPLVSEFKGRTVPQCVSLSPKLWRHSWPFRLC